MDKGDFVTVRCDLCGADNYDIVYKTYEGDLGALEADYKISDHGGVQAVRIVRCRKCGLVYANPRPRASFLSDNYRSMEDRDYVAQEAGRRLTARMVLKKLRRFQRRRGRLLDIGCAAGFLLDEARRDGWEVAGVEISEWAVRFAREHLLLTHVHRGTLQDAGLEPNSFDAVVMTDTIEHLFSPREVLIAVRRLLKPTGILCLNTPDIDSWVSRMLKARWWGVKQAHLYYFNRRMMKRLLRETGYVPLHFGTHTRSFALSYWLQRLGRHDPRFKGLIHFVLKNKALSRRPVTWDLGDQLEVVARKSRSLEYLYELETEERREVRQDAKVVVVLPAYNAAKTLKKTVADIPKGAVHEIILVDDASLDDTVRVARELGLTVFVHKKNRGYGANQKTCYKKALERGADIVVMVHPDYQYDPRVIPELIEPIRRGRADAVFGSRMMKGGALQGGMPLWKHNANILLTALENVVLGASLTEYHSGFRAYSAKYLHAVAYQLNSDDFVFDTEIIAQGIAKNLRIEEIPIRTRYFDEASSIRLGPCLCYGLGILMTLIRYKIHASGLLRLRAFR